MAPVEDLAAAIEEALANPIDYPPLEQALIPEDTVALALEPGTPAAAELVAGVWRVLERRGVAAENGNGWLVTGVGANGDTREVTNNNATASTSTTTAAASATVAASATLANVENHSDSAPAEC